MGDCGYYVSQTASIICKKDRPTILTSTCTALLDMGYERLKGSQLIITHCSETGKTQLKFIPRGATCIEVKDLTFRVCVEKMIILQKNVGIIYTVNGGEGEISFMTTCHVATMIMAIAAKTKIVLCIPKFTLFVTGDLSFYADSCGKHKSCSYWCIYCTLCRL
jgi:hypothetical protein